MSPTPTARRLEIVRMGHPALRTVAEPVPEELFGSDSLERLAGSMVRTMIDAGGVGLAAPQVAEPLRLFSFWIPGEGDDDPVVAPTVIVNPVVRAVTDETELDWEGCLSIPELRGLVPRPREVEVDARTVTGEPLSFRITDFGARVVLHETDHLDGVLFLDRMDELGSLAFEDEWERYVLPGLLEE